MTLPRPLRRLQQGLTSPLPGWGAQRTMAPTGRTQQNGHVLIKSDHRESSVLVLLYPDGAQCFRFILIRRPAYEGVHSDQIALPGGSREGDETRQETALRETAEEIGLPSRRVRVLGTLSPLYIAPSNFIVYPYVGYTPARPTYRPDPREVAEILEPPLAVLLDETARRCEPWQLANLGWVAVPYFLVGRHKVWGATAMMLAEFAVILQQGNINSS